MGKLHELIAVEPDLKQNAIKTVGEVAGLFEKGIDRLVGQVRTYSPLKDGGEKYPDEKKLMSTKVNDELAKVERVYGQWMDAVVSKEVSNTKTAADIIVDGETLIAGLPATALLNLESKLETLRGVYRTIPTNDLATRWTLDSNQGVWVSDPEVTYRTQKEQIPLTLYEATKEHPAQVQLVTKDTREGTWTTLKTSGMISPTQKAEMLDRLETLLVAVKKARQRANDTTASDIKVSDTIFKYIRGS